LIDIANNGTVVGIDFDGPGSGRAVLHFYAPGGAELGTASIGFLRATAFASNGSVYCVNDGINGLRVFTPDGTELYDLGTGNWFAVSADGARIALARDDGIEVFVRGASTGRIPIASPFIRQMTFSPDGWELAFIDRGSLSLYRVASLTGQFRYLELNPRLSFTSVDISSENPVVLAGLDEDLGEGMPARHTRGFVYLFDTSGHRLWSDEVDYKDWNAHMPEVLFTGSRAFRVRTLDNVSEYRY
jgi:hypothetical protein